MTFYDLWLSVRDYVWHGGSGLAVGAFLQHYIEAYRGRVKEIEYFVAHDRLGISADDKIHGAIRVQWKEQELRNLYSSTVTVENTSSKDYKDLNLAVYSGDPVFILSERVEVANSIFIPQRRPSYEEALKFPEGGSPSEHQLFSYYHRREYVIPVLNRGDRAIFRYLTTVPNGDGPGLFVDVLEPGLKIKQTFNEPQQFGAPGKWALGLVTCPDFLYQT